METVNNPPRKRFIALFALTFLLITFLTTILIYNRAIFGTWAPFVNPERIDYHGRRYYPGTSTGDLTDLHKAIPNFYWGRDLYVYRQHYLDVDVHRKSDTYMQVLLENQDGTYSAYTLSGGP